MSRTIPAGIQTDLDAGVVALSTCVKITAVDGTVFAFTDYHDDLVVSTVTYTAIGGYTPSAVASSAELNVDNVDLVGYFEANGITLTKIRAGYLEGAAIEKFKVNPRKVSDGIIKVRKGTIGRQGAGDLNYSLEVRGLFQGLQQPIGKVLSATCRAELGDTECKVPIVLSTWSASTAVSAGQDYDAGIGDYVIPSSSSPYMYKCITAGTTHTAEPTWNTTLGGITTETGGVQWETLQKTATTMIALAPITSRAKFATGLTSFPDDWFNGGVITFTAGDNAGLSREVKSFTQSQGTIETFIPFPFDVAVIDGFSIVAGCDKSLATCRDTFNNVYNRRAEDYVPGVDRANQTPKVK